MYHPPLVPIDGEGEKQRIGMFMQSPLVTELSSWHWIDGNERNALGIVVGGSFPGIAESWFVRK